MLSALVYVARLLGSVSVSLVGLMLLASSLVGDRSVYTIGISTAITAAGLLAWPRRPNAWRHDPPTDRQIAFARDLGIHIPKGISKGDLSELISQAKAARDAF